MRKPLFIPQTRIIGFICGLSLLLVLLCTGISVRPVAANVNSSVYTTDQIIVNLVDGVSDADINAEYGTLTIGTLPGNTHVYLLQVASGVDTLQVATAMHQDGRFLYAEPNFRSAAPEATSIDTYGWGVDTYGWGVDTYGWGESTYGWGVDTYGWGGGTHNIGATIYGWPPGSTNKSPRLLYGWEWGGNEIAHYQSQPAVNLVYLNPTTTVGTGANITVAVLDTGIDISHALLTPVLTTTGYDFIDDDSVPDDVPNGLDDDGDGFIDEIVGHGTHVAGIVHRVAPDAQIMPLRVLDSDGQGDSFIIAKAILYAADNGADVINLSLGTIWPSHLLQDVVAQVTAEGVLVVAAAGNLNTDIAQYPAASPCALAVTAVGPGLHKSGYASYGLWVDVTGPGIPVYSTYPGGFSWWQGTSMSTPFVAGQAALLYSLVPTLTPADVATFIAGTAQPVDTANPDYTDLLGAGRVRIADSMNALINGNWPTIVSPLSDCTAP